MNPKNPQRFGVKDIKVNNDENYSTKIENSGTMCAKRNHYLLMEIEAQKKIISQLFQLLSSYRQLAKPNGFSYCSHDHLKCKIDHYRFNFVILSHEKMRNIPSLNHQETLMPADNFVNISQERRRKSDII